MSLVMYSAMAGATVAVSSFFCSALGFLGLSLTSKAEMIARMVKRGPRTVTVMTDSLAGLTGSITSPGIKMARPIQFTTKKTMAAATIPPRDQPMNPPVVMDYNVLYSYQRP